MTEETKRELIIDGVLLIICQVLLIILKLVCGSEVPWWFVFAPLCIGIVANVLAVWILRDIIFLKEEN